MKYGLSHDKGKNISYTELENLTCEVEKSFEKFWLGYLIGKIEIHPLHNGIRFSPSKEYYQKQINLALKTKIFPDFKKSGKSYIFSLHKD